MGVLDGRPQVLTRKGALTRAKGQRGTEEPGFLDLGGWWPQAATFGPHPDRGVGGVHAGQTPSYPCAPITNVGAGLAMTLCKAVVWERKGKWQKCSFCRQRKIRLPLTPNCPHSPQTSASHEQVQ